MNGKKVNRIFLAVVLLNITTIVLLSVLYPIFQLGMIPNLILSQLIVFLPAAFGVLLAKENLIQFAGFHKIEVSSVFMTILFTWLCMPLVTLINAISMLFVDNAVASMTSDLAGSPLMATFLVMSILGPLNEELVCRGIFYQGYKRSGTMMQAMLLSALLFALLHMNFNQAAYAFAIGIIAVLLVEATGSLWSSVILHVTINMQPVLLMYMEDGADIQEAQELLTTDMLLLVISVYLVIAVVTTALEGCVLAWIAKNEKREENHRAVWKTRKYIKEGKVVTVPLLIAVIILFAVMVLTAL